MKSRESTLAQIGDVLQRLTKEITVQGKHRTQPDDLDKKQEGSGAIKTSDDPSANTTKPALILPRVQNRMPLMDESGPS
jgi:hypothetical protein